MATHSIMKVGSISSQKDGDGNNIPIVSVTDFEPRSFNMKLSKASPDQLAILKQLEGKLALIPTSEGAMNGSFWMSLKQGSIMPLPTAKG